MQIEALGESMLLVRFGTRIDEALSDRVHAAVAALRGAALPGVRDIVPSYAAVAVDFAPADARLTDAGDVWEARIGAIRDALATPPAAHGVPPRRIDIPVCYGGVFGADLEAVARHAGCTVEEVIARHCAVEYTVAMLGFAPGFAYLLGLDERLRVPRRADPRTRVPAGSVAIGGAQTGIYPRELPGGWNLIGRTPHALFNASRRPPALLAPGDRVRFVAIDADAFAGREPA